MDSCFAIGTLLNRLFGTNFDVMDETKRQQTTKGQSSITHLVMCEGPFALVLECWRWSQLECVRLAS